MAADDIDNIVLEHLKNIQAEQSSARERDSEILRRLAGLESMIARVGRDQANAYADQIEDRHGMDALRGRIERIERRLEINSWSRIAREGMTWIEALAVQRRS